MSDRRFNIVLPNASAARLESLKETTESASYAEVFRNALRIYEALIAEQKAGNTFLLQQPSGAATKFNIFYEA